MLTGALVVLAAGVVMGDGGGLRLARARAGPYLVSVWIDPDPPRIGSLDISVAVMKPSDGQSEPNVEVQARAKRSGAPGTTSPIALPRGAGGNLLLHHGELDLPEPGRWRISLAVSGPAGSGEAAFEVEARPRAVWPWVLSGVVAIGLILVPVVRRGRSRVP